MLSLHFHRSPDLIYFIFCMIADSSLMTFFVLQLSTQFSVSHDWKSLIFKLTNCSVLVLPGYNIILIFLMPNENGKFRMPYDNNKNIEEAEKWVSEGVCLASSFGIKTCCIDSFLKVMNYLLGLLSFSAVIWKQSSRLPVEFPPSESSWHEWLYSWYSCLPWNSSS